MLVTIEDRAAVRAKVAEGDLSAAGELELTDEEQAWLSAAASDEAEVVASGINFSLAGVTTGTTESADRALVATDRVVGR